MFQKASGGRREFRLEFIPRTLWDAESSRFGIVKATLLRWMINISKDESRSFIASALFQGGSS